MSERGAQASNRVLVVIGEPASRAFVSRVLESVLMDVRAASRYEQAMELIRNEAFGLLIVDPTLPRVDGVELLREIRREHPTLIRKTIVIVDAGTPLAEKFEELSPCRLIDRPVLRQQLITAVSDCLKEPSDPS
ncbi:MAG TPA: response regulator [Thermoanaerobaculia bacterium]|nr:response regulator [Thermoanaerobaculia bacterium]